MIKVAKCWQQEASVGLVWQIKNKKNFLLCEFHGIKPAIKIVDQKPSALTVNGAFATLARKYLTGSVLAGYFVVDAGSESWILKWQQQSQETFWVVFTSDQGGQIELIDHQWVSHIRWSKKGIYTHKKNQKKEDYSWSFALKEEDNLIHTLKNFSAQPPSEEPATQSSLEPVLAEEFLEVQKQAKRKVARRLRTVKKAFEKSQTTQPSRQGIFELQTKARLLKMFSYLIKDDTTELVLDPLQTGEPSVISISVDPDQSIGEQINDLYVTAKKKEKGLQMGQSRLLKEEDEKNLLEASFKKLSEEKLTHEEVMALLKFHKLDLEPQQEKSSDKSADKETPYKVYKKEGLASFLVGKGSKENDLLTKSAASNDFWCHVVDGSGSHVIVPFKGLAHPSKHLEAIRKNAAILAIHFSKKRQDQRAEVYFTKKQHLKKKKGLADGLWIVEKSDNFFISYSDDELKAILDCQI